MKVANEILRQLGGNKFRVMTGSHNFSGSSNSLSMKLRKNKSKASHLTITLDTCDTYTMEFFKCNVRSGIKTVEKHEGLYNDMLQKIFTEVTGMYTSL